jgi:hypothetical protein
VLLEALDAEQLCADRLFEGIANDQAAAFLRRGSSTGTHKLSTCAGQVTGM